MVWVRVPVCHGALEVCAEMGYSYDVARVCWGSMVLCCCWDIDEGRRMLRPDRGVRCAQVLVKVL